MDALFHPLPTSQLPVNTDLLHLDERPARPVTYDSPALEVMTDLRVLDPVSIAEDATLDAAHTLMVSRAIRLLFVTDGDHHLTGVITATDVLGERPMQCIHQDGKRHTEILVRDVMTPRTQLDTLQLKDVSHAKVGQLIATMKQLGRQHTLVVEHNAHTGHHELCGLFSTSHIARRLGVPLPFIRVPQTFSEIQHTLTHPA